MYPKISILIPAYQVEAYIGRCLDSALCQTYPNLDIIIIDDGSTDQTREIILEYKKNHSTITAYFHPHQGLSIVRNLLLEKNTSDYFFFLDADDFISHDTIMILYQLAVHYQAEIVQCDMERTTNDIRSEHVDFGSEYLTDAALEQTWKLWGNFITVYTKSEALQSYNRTRNGPRCMSAGKLYKKEVFHGIAYPANGCTNEDEYVAFLLLENCTHFVTINQKLYGYYQNPNSIMHKPFSEEHYDIIPAIQTSIQFYQKLQIPEQVVRIQFRYLTILQRLYLETKKNMPENTRWLEFFVDEYKKTLPCVLEHIPLPIDLYEWFQDWSQNPDNAEIKGYWYYVESGILSP